MDMARPSNLIGDGGAAVREMIDRGKIKSSWLFWFLLGIIFNKCWENLRCANNMIVAARSADKRHALSYFYYFPQTPIVSSPRLASFQLSFLFT